MTTETAQVMPDQEGKYVYCIIASPKPCSFGPLGIGGRADEVYTVHHEDLAAVVSDTPLVVYDPTRQNVLTHEQVNETVMRDFTILPLAFGTLFRSAQDVRELMRRTHSTLRDVLTKMEGKVEFGLKVSWDRERILSELEREHSDIRQLKEQINAVGADAAYMAQIQLGRLIETAFNARADAFVRDIQARLRDTTVATQVNKPIGDRMILNAAFLIERTREAEFIQAVDETAAQYEGRLFFKYGGPWPPYNFVSIRLRIEPGQEGNAPTNA